MGSLAEISALLQRPALAFLKKDPDELMELMDADKNGYVSFEEFSLALGGGPVDADDEDTPKMDKTDSQTSKKNRVSLHSAHSRVSKGTDKPAPTRTVTWKSSEMKNMSTTWLMKEIGWDKVIAQIVTLFCCCWWVPLIFFLGAANVDTDSCDFPLSVWLIVGALLMMMFVPVSGCVLVVTAKLKCRMLFKLVAVLPILGFFLLLVWLILYLVHIKDLVPVADRTDCLKEGWSGVDPIKLAFSWIFVLLPFYCCSTCLIWFVTAFLHNLTMAKIAAEV